MDTTKPASDTAFSPAVKAVQARKGSREAYAKMDGKGGWTRTITEDLARFIAERDSFYIAIASADGQPYAQHRGGAPGFLKVLDERTLAFADYRGNRQYITAGNLSENARAFLFLMDYPNRRRIKIWGRARVVDDDPELLARLAEGSDAPEPEQAILFEVEVWDRNCPQYITPRYTDADLAPQVDELNRRIATLEAELRHARASTARVIAGLRRRAA